MPHSISIGTTLALALLPALVAAAVAASLRLSSRSRSRARRRLAPAAPALGIPGSGHPLPDRAPLAGPVLARLRAAMRRGASRRRTPCDRHRTPETSAIRRLRDDAECAAQRRLAARLHDGVGQSLQGLNLGLRQARDLARQGKAVPTELLERLVEEAGAALKEVRTIGRELRPPLLERLGLANAVRLHCAEIAERCGRDIRVHSEGDAWALEEWIEQQCFLAFREALSNAVRHAGASRILVAVRVRPGKRLSLLVLDDGVGFDRRQTARRATGIGLASIRERAERVQGRALIRSRPGRGTAVRLCVPLAREPLTCP